MIALDTSVMLAILLAEEDAPMFRYLMGRAGRALVSAGTAVEFAAVASRDDDLFAAAMAFLSEPFIDVEPVSAAQATIAAEAYRRYGKGHHRAGLNLGACRELAPSKQESTTYEPSLVCKLLILGCRLLIPDRLLGDIFAYALAHERRVPLLFKGDDFSQTDIEDARGSKTA